MTPKVLAIPTKPVNFKNFEKVSALGLVRVATQPK